MIRALGVGVREEHGAWLLRRLCLRPGAGELTALLADRSVEARALLECIAGHRVAAEGRVWIGDLPVMRETLRRVRGLVGDVVVGAPPPDRSLLRHVLLKPGVGLGRLLPLPHPRERAVALQALADVSLGARVRESASALSAVDRARLEVARCFAHQPRGVVVRDVDTALPAAAAGEILALIRRLARTRRVPVIASLASGAAARAYADHVIVLSEGRVVFDGLPGALTEAHVACAQASAAPGLA